MATRPRVLFVTSVFEEVINGPATYAQYLWQHLRDDDDIEFHLVAPNVQRSHGRIHSVKSSGRRVMWDTQRRALEMTSADPRSWIVHGNSAYMMFQFLRYPGPWMVQVNDYEAATVWKSPASVIRRNGLRRFVSLAWRRRQERRVVAHASRVIGNSNYVCDQLRAYGVRDSANQFEVIYKAVDAQSFARPNGTCDAPITDSNEARQILFIGNDWRRKGLLTLLESLRIAKERVGNLKLVVIGPNRSQHGTILAAASRMGLSDDVLLKASVQRERLPQYMWNSDLFVLPSHREALGVSILEALAAGLPVVASNVGGIPEIIQSEDEGTLVPPGNARLLADAICNRLNNSQLRERARIAGPAKAREFAVDKMVARVKQIYLDLAASQFS